MTIKICKATFPGGKCGQRALRHAKQLCRAHLTQDEKGLPLSFVKVPMKPRLSPLRTLWWIRQHIRAQPAPYTDLKGDCWLWTQRVNDLEYGLLRYKENSMFKAHRASWELHHGTEVPTGLDIAHLCNRPACVQPLHLDPQTRKQNMQYAKLHGRTKGPSLKGSTHPLSVLVEADIPIIRKLAASGMVHKDIGHRFGVSAECIGNVVRRVSWWYIP